MGTAIILLLATLRAFSVQPGDILWTYSSGLTNHTDLALGPDGTIYLGWGKNVTETVSLPSGAILTTNYYTNCLFAIDTNGHEKWQLPDTGQRLAIRSDGKILAEAGTTHTTLVTFPSGATTTAELPVDNGLLSGINPDGSSWLTAIKAEAVAIAADDNISVLNIEVPDGSPHTNGVARMDLQSNGTGWTNLSLTFPYTSSDKPPVIAPDGLICYTTLANNNPILRILLPSGNYLTNANPSFPNLLQAFLPDGTLKYGVFETNVNYSVPSIGSDGTLYLASARIFPGSMEPWVEWYFRSIHLPNDFRWTITNTARFGPAVIDRTNNVYVGSGQRLFALTSGGAERWTYDADSDVDLCPALAADGTVYVATHGGKLLAIDTKNGDLLWQYDSGRPINFPPTLAANGTVYLLVDSTDLVAVQGTAASANAPWPQDRHDAQRTSRALQASSNGVHKNGDGKFSLRLNLEPGKTYKVEASENLETWTEIGSFTSSSSAQTFLDESSADKPKRFYRLVVPPPTP